MKLVHDLGCLSVVGQCVQGAQLGLLVCSIGWKTVAQYCINKVMSCMVACLQPVGLPDPGMLRTGVPLHVGLIRE